jgi:UDPglucose--hexose-1-phosphate uridylyltransferase
MTQKNIKSEIRKDYLLDRYVIITPLRAQRPKETKTEEGIKENINCPFCPENINKKLIIDEIKSKKGWATLSLPNIFPALSLENEKAYGTQELIIDSPYHTKTMANFSLLQIEQVLHLYAKRTKALSQNQKLEYILCFKNQGANAGASMIHSHSQVLASKILPPRVKEELRLAREKKEKTGICPYCQTLKNELNSPRKIWEDKYVGAFAPFASEYHYEAWIFTKRHLDNITNTNKQEIRSLAKALQIITKKLDHLHIAYNLYMHQVVSDKEQHFYIKIQPRDSVWAGVELGSGLIINSVPPEAAAAEYRS